MLFRSNVRLSLQTLELLSFPPERIRVLLNRSNSNVGINRGEVERALDTKIQFHLPSDRAVPLSVNRGAPVVLADTGAEFSRAMTKLARELLAAGPVAENGGRRWLRSKAKAS